MGVRPHLYLLFMVYTKINNHAVWERFLQGAVRGVEYTALVHCKSEDVCRKQIHSALFEVIRPVETRYCLDLVSGMNALLKAALLRRNPGSPNDKFVFLSDTTLPIKPFAYVYKQLTATPSSDFCIFPRNEWAEVYEGMPDGRPVTVRVAVKHHQWIVLGRRHAELSVQRSGEQMDLMQQLQLNMGFRNTGCLDEFWHFATAYRSLNISSGAAKLDLEDFTGGPLDTRNYEIQGRCNTFAHWVERASGITNNITTLAGELQSDAGTDIMPASETRPASIQRLSRSSLVALRASPFLFMRKVEDGTAFSGCETLDEAFAVLAFSSPPEKLPSQGQAWRGNGIWLDNRLSPVAVSSLDGAARLVGASSDMRARGYYCGNRLEVTFTSGYRASATLSGDGQRLQWGNGVIWPRAADPGSAAKLAAAASFST